MYESFFNLTGKPFDLLPNPNFLYLSKSHKKALTYLDYAIRERVGFILLTGEIGSGKTTIVRSLINKHHDNIILARIFNTSVNSAQLFAMINEDFGIAVKSLEKTELLRDLNEFLIEQYGKGNKPVLIIDEAQNLTPETLEDVRMLSNLETDCAKLLQIILVGQPELLQTLALPELVQLRQRICCYCHIYPLKREEIREYILYRLEIAGNRGAVELLPLVTETIWKYSRGIPRLINIICDFLMLSAFAEETRRIDEGMVQDIIGDLDFENQYWGECKPVAAGDEKNRHFDTGQLPETSPRDSEVKELLTEILNRLDTLEKRDSNAGGKTIEEINQHLEQTEQDLREHMRVTEQNIDELRQGLQKRNGSEDIFASLPEASSEKRKGFLGKLFRAA